MMIRKLYISISGEFRLQILHCLLIGLVREENIVQDYLCRFVEFLSYSRFNLYYFWIVIIVDLCVSM